jgi:colanic acid/amylovoran biosynthesis glycosyltransferase
MLGILIPEFPNQTHIFFWREIECLREMGIKVVLLSTRKPEPGACRHEFGPAAAAETHYVYPPAIGAIAASLGKFPAGISYLAGLKESSISRRARGMGLLACAADLLAESRRRGITHIHCHSCADAAHVVALCRILGGPSYSLTLHGDLPVYGTDHRSKFARAACVTCAGPHLIAQITQQGVAPESVISNWMGLDTDHFSPREKRNAQAGRLDLVTVARLHACKGHRFAIAAVRRAVDQGLDVRYTLAGQGPEEQNLRKLIAELNLGDRVKLLGTQSEGEVLALLQRSDAFVLASVGMGEAGPVSLMEAMSCGLPAICSIIGATPQMMTDGVEGMLVKQEDVDGLTSAIGRLARDPELRQAMGAAARKRAIAEFDRRATAKRLVDFIELHAGVKLRD